MVRRLVLGCASVGGSLVESLVEKSGPGSILVVTDRKGRADDFRADGVAATEGDPNNPANYPESTNVILVAGSDPEKNRDVARTARAHFPDASLVVYLGRHPEESVRADVEAVADDVVDPGRIVADHVFDAVGSPQSERLYRLMRVLRKLDGRLAIVMHDNPDPDAIASGLALQSIAKRASVESDVCYFGDISHQENRALVNLLDLDLRVLEDAPSPDEYAGYALVDHSRPGVNDRLPTDTTIDIVVDHHPPRAPIEATYVDLRSGVGATSTLLTEYLELLGIVPETRVATALMFGIRVDTNDFTREVSTADFEAAAYLFPHVDADVLQRVETPSLTSDTMETLARAISNREVRGDILTSNVGDIRERDALAQAADHLLGMEGVDVAVVYGVMDGTVYVSGRAHGGRIDLGEMFRDALAPIGSAGGHADMAGAQIPLGILADVGDDSRESLATIVTEIVAGRIFETLEYPPTTPLLDSEVTFEYPLDE